MFEENQDKFLKELQDRGFILIVEGKKDRKVLEKTGLRNIIEISGKRLEDVIDIIKSNGNNPVLILTDYDKEGIQTYKKLKKLLMSDGIKIDDNLRKHFKKTFLIYKIEELSSYFK